MGGGAPGFRDDAPLSADDSQDLILPDDHVLDLVNLDLGSRVLADQDPVPGLDFEGDSLSVVIEASGADRHDLSFLRLLFGRVRTDNSTLDLLLGLDSLDQNAIVK